MNEQINTIFQSFIEKHADDELPIDFTPLLKQYTQFKDPLEKKIKAYQKIMGVFSDKDSSSKEKLPQQLGRVIGGCTLLKILGQGGMGVVYLARQEKLNRDVVVKVLRPFAVDNQALKERFLRESRTIGRLNHKNIVPVYDIGEEESSFYIIMKYVPGIPLNKLISSLAGKDRSILKIKDLTEAIANNIEPSLAKSISINGKSPTEFFCNLITKVADAVQYAHDNGVIHRDIKPSNIIVEPNGNPVLLDFGLSHDEVEENLTVTGEFLGTPIYSAPETFLKNESHDNRQLDVYSLGVTLYEALTGNLPYEGNSIYEIYANIKNKEPVRPKSRWKNIPNDLETIISTSISKNIEYRYKTIFDLKNDLINFLDYLPIQAKPPSYSYKTKIWLKRRRKSISLITLLLAISLGSYLYFQKEITQSKKDLKQIQITQQLREALHGLIEHDVQTTYSKVEKLYNENPDNVMLNVWYFGLKAKLENNINIIAEKVRILHEKDPEDLFVKLAEVVVYHELKNFEKKDAAKKIIFQKFSDEKTIKVFPIYLNALGADDQLVLEFTKFGLSKYPYEPDLNFFMSVFCKIEDKDNNCGIKYLEIAAEYSNRYLNSLSSAYVNMPANQKLLHKMINNLEKLSHRPLANLTADYFFDLGKLYLRLGDCKKFLQYLNTAINLEPTNTKLLDFRKIKHGC
ncbi:MAG: serine/threonine protein kinase [Deltaproteobacteria bacterium]|nr:serine/threonine protein kinase [Deltaproteobacteria bacterium]